MAKKKVLFNKTMLASVVLAGLSAAQTMLPQLQTQYSPQSLGIAGIVAAVVIAMLKAFLTYKANKAAGSAAGGS